MAPEINYEGGLVRDPDSKAVLVRVDEGAVTLDAGDLTIGAVELKDSTTDNRAVVDSDGNVWVKVTVLPGQVADGGSLPAQVSAVAGSDGSATHVLKTDAAGILKVDIAGSDVTVPVSGDFTARYAGGKLATTAQVTASGTTTVLTPASGNRVRLYWVSAINDPDASASPRIRVGFDGAADYLYSGYAVAHWEIFTGAIDQAVVVNLDQAGDVAVTLHYEEL